MQVAKQIGRASAVALILGSVLCWSDPAHGWDGRRKGGVLGVGFGPARITTKEEDAASTARFGVGLSLRFGYAPSDHWALTLGGGDALGFDGDGLGFTVTAGMLARYYLEAAAPSFFLEFGLGLGFWIWAPWDEDGGAGGAGIHPIGAIGYEVVPHWSVELLAAGGPTLPSGSSSSTLLLCASWHGY